MGTEYKNRQIRSSFRKFRDYSEDLLNSDSNSFENRLRIFIHLCENDEIMKRITIQLKECDVEFDIWWNASQNTGGSFGGSKTYELPVEEIKRIALLYQLLLKIHDKEIDFFEFCLDYYGGSKYDQMIYDFNSNITRELVREINYKLEEIIEEIDEEIGDKGLVPEQFLVIIQDNRTNIGSNNTFSGDASIGGGAKIDK